jgi:hypothetical protein
VQRWWHETGLGGIGYKPAGDISGIQHAKSARMPNLRAEILSHQPVSTKDRKAFVYVRVVVFLAVVVSWWVDMCGWVIPFVVVFLLDRSFPPAFVSFLFLVEPSFLFVSCWSSFFLSPFPPHHTFCPVSSCVCSGGRERVGGLFVRVLR